MKFGLTVALGFLLLFSACKRSKVGDLPIFDKSSAYGFVRKQTDFGPRVPGSEGHRNCKDWLVSQFKEYGLGVNEQAFDAKTFDGKTLPATNIIASTNPGAKQRILLAAHWDTRPFADHDPDTSLHHKPILGADDGGSGVAVLLEIAKLLQQKPLSKIGIDIVLFDAEDYGNDNGGDPLSWCLGAQHWSKLAKQNGYRADYGILLDMVGGKDPRFTWDAVSIQYASRVLNKVWKIGEELGYKNYFVPIAEGALTDDHVFVNSIAEIPMIDIINRPLNSPTGFVSHWHTHKDTPDAVDPVSLEMVGKTLLLLLFKEDVDEI